MNLKNRLLLFFKPIQVWLQRRGYIESGFTHEIVNNLMGRIKAGDILLSYESGRWTSLFIKGEWDHAAIVDHNLYVVEAVGDLIIGGKNYGGVRKVPLEEWLWKKNHVAVLRYREPIIALGAAYCSNSFIGKSYDYAFSTECNETLYCSELVYASYFPFEQEFMKFIPKNKEILPIDYLKEPSLHCVYNSRVWLNP